MNLEQFLSQLTTDTVILTPNRRLSSFLNDKFNDWKIAAQQNTWVSLRTFPFSDWLQQLWSANVNESDRLLTDLQMEYLWREIIARDAESNDLLKLDATAKQAIEAMRRLILWQVPITSHDFIAEPDWKQFYRWQQSYIKECSLHGFTDSFQIPGRLLNSIATNTWTKLLPKKIIVMGFDEVAPLWKSFLDSLSSFSEIIAMDLSKANNTKKRYEFANWQDELGNMIQWAKQQQEQNPTQTIACIIPSLAKKRSVIEKSFIKAFAPQTFLDLSDKDEMPYNMSAGQVLAGFEIINAAIKILELSNACHSLEKGNLSMQTIRFLLRNPFIGGYYKEYANRAALESRIAKLQTYNLSQDFFSKLLTDHCPILALQFQRLIAITSKRETSLLSWAEIFNKKLEAMSWPGDRELSSQNYQLVLRMKELFNELLGFDLLVDKCDAQQALTLFQKLLDDTIFQVKTPKQNLQILGSLEAAGMIFDKIWIMELNDNQWPAAANPSPFIPHRLQREYQLPHANAERELNFSQILLERYFNSSVEIYMSYAKENDDQEECHCSTLIRNIPLSDCRYNTENLISIIKTQSSIEEFVDNQAPAISDTELATIHGGTSILTLQAACPFRNFATNRLQARALPEPEPGLTALERGKIIHATLDLFWQQVKTHVDLVALNPASKQNIITSAATAAIISINMQLYQHAPKLFTLELNRVIKHINQWLDLEIQRKSFSVIATEQALETHFIGLPLKLRIDRIDRLDNGALVLIDYKSNIISVNKWFGERLDEPQLPLYALIYSENVEAIIFGQIKTNEFSIKGIGSLDAESFGIENIAKSKASNSTSWKEQKQQWQLDLQKLAEDFMNGVATVDPKNGSQTCAYCDLPSFCRINEKNNYAE